jgi:hypothetical protein
MSAEFPNRDDRWVDGCQPVGQTPGSVTLKDGRVLKPNAANTALVDDDGFEYERVGSGCAERDGFARKRQ